MSIDANAGDRIKISPTTSGVAALPPNVSLFYEVTETLTTVDPPSGDDLVITRQLYAGGETFTWTLDDSTVASHGTYWDGTPWVIPANGSTVTVKAVSPAPKEILIEDAVCVGGTTDLTVRYDGVMVNPIMGVPQNPATVESGTYVGSVGGDTTNGRGASSVYGLTSDNRVAADLPVANAQSFLDTYFNISQFNQYKTLFPGDSTAGSGLTLNTGDIMALTQSIMDPTFKNFNAQNSRIGATPNGWSPRSGIKAQAFLYIVSAAPVANEFRPPVQWLSTDGDRPTYTEADLLDLTPYHSSIGQGGVYDIGAFYPDGASSWADVWGEGTPGTKPPVSAFLPSPILVDDGYYSSSLVAFNILPGVDTTYGGQAYNVTNGYLFNEMLRSTLNDTDRLLAQKKLVQAGIDCLGAMKCRIACTGGAGQRAGQTTPLALFALRNLGTQVSSIGTSVEELTRWIWGYTTSEWNALNDVQQRNLRGASSYEENVSWTKGLMDTVFAATGDPSIGASVGATYSGTYSGVIGSATATDETCSTIGVITNPGTGEVQMQGATGDYHYTGSFGRVDFDTYFDFPGADNQSQGTHAAGHTNLIGVTLTSGGEDYYIVAVSENVEEDSFTIGQTVRVYVDRPFTAPPSGSVTLSAFRSGNTNDVYYIREPQTPAKFAWATPSAYNDNYSQYFHKNANLPYLLMRRIDGNSWSDLGSAGQLMGQYYRGGNDQCDWQVFNNVSPDFGSVVGKAAFNSNFSVSSTPD